MADKMLVTSLIRSRITLQKVPSKNGCPCRENMLARSGLLDRRAQAEVASALRSDTPTLVALADVTAGDWRNSVARVGGPGMGRTDARKELGVSAGVQ